MNDPTTPADPELASAAHLARAVLAEFRAQDEAFVRGAEPPPDYHASCYAMAACLHRLLAIIDPA